MYAACLLVLTACLACRYACRPQRATSRRIMATSMSVSLVWTLRSQSTTSRRLRSNQANVRSTIHRFGCWPHPRTPGGRLTTSSSQPPVAIHQSAILLSLVGLVRPDLGEARDTIRQSCKKEACAKGVVHVGWRDRDGEGQAQGIDQQVALAAFDARVSIVATDTT